MDVSLNQLRQAVVNMMLKALLASGLTAAALMGGDLSKYANFQLGTDLPTVVKQTGASPAQIKMVHRRPILIQELEWRPEAVLAQAIYREGVKAVTAGASPMAVKRGIDKAVEIVVNELKSFSKPVSGEMIAQVGRISANSDTTIGDVIAQAMQKVGKDGVITVEESKTMTTELETV
jgi:hypothetical protein